MKLFAEKKFHINEKGDVKSCRAYVKSCPITAKTGDPHFDTESDARIFYELSQDEKTGTLKALKRPRGKILKNDLRKTPSGERYVLAYKEDGTLDRYMFGDMTDNFDDLWELHKADPTKQYQDGDCAVLANELWNTNPYVEDYYILSTEDEPEIGIHQFVKLKDGSYADSQGIWSEEKLVSYWKTIDPTVQLKVEGTDQPDLKPDPSSIEEPSNEELYNAITKIINKRFEK